MEEESEEDLEVCPVCDFPSEYEEYCEECDCEF